MQEKEEQKMYSLYEYIKMHVVNNELPGDFSLPTEPVEGKLRFADGALDGMTMYHMMGTELDEKEQEKMHEIIRLISDGEKVRADEALGEFAKKHRALTVIDDFENAIRENRQNLSVANLYRYAVRLITGSEDRECVKYGLEILELFSLKDEEVKDIVRTLGLSDEFTLFAIYIMLQWDNANEEIFSLAQKVRGWGRIHAVEKLQPETEEIRRWLLSDGINNQVLPDYSALTCFEKADVFAMLENEISQEEFQSIGRILKAMLIEGPVPGISAVENREKLFMQYAKHAKEHELTDADYETISQIYDYCNREEKKLESVVETYQGIKTQK